MSAPKPKWKLYAWLLLGVTAVIAAWLLDNRVDAALNVAGKPALQKLAWWCSKIGEGWVVALWGIACAIVFMLMKRPEIAAEIFFVAATSELTGLICIIIRAFVGRARPNARVPQGIYGVWHDGHWIIGKYDFSSFPSGHSAVAAGLAVTTWLFSKRWGMVAMIYALAVMWSRIAQGAHHLSDVVASAILSIPITLVLKRNCAAANEIFFQKLADKK